MRPDARLRTSQSRREDARGHDVLKRLLAIAALLLMMVFPARAALDPALVAKLGAEDSDAKVEAIRK
ncbi:MAG: hypothetical protein ACK56N_16115, partial [Betaproteobacteria bacterium]